MTIPNGLPILSRGSHDRASGKACIMNAISYLNGDIEITDAPDCVAEVLRHAFITVNDRICSHSTTGHEVLCPQCSHLMWLYGARIIGTAEDYKLLSYEQRRDLAAKICRDLITRLESHGQAGQLHEWLDTMLSRNTAPETLMIDIVDKLTRPSNWTGVHQSQYGVHQSQYEMGRNVLIVTMRIFDEYMVRNAPEGPTEEQFQKVADEAKVAVYTA